MFCNLLNMKQLMFQTSGKIKFIEVNGKLLTPCRQQLLIIFYVKLFAILLIIQQMKISHYDQNFKQINIVQKTQKLEQPVKLYKIMPTNLVYYFDGNITLGNQILHPSITLILITIINILFLAIIIIQKLSFFSYIVITLSLLFYFISLYFLLQSLTTDPGIIPKQTINYNINTKNIPKNIHFHTSQIFIINNKDSISTIKYCQNCSLYRNNTTYHCFKCDVCIIGHDHHCQWLGKCIGRYNYKYFVDFLLSLNIMFIFELCLTIYLIVSQKYHFLPWIIINLILLIFTVIYCFQLLLFHLFLIYQSKTTRQYFKEQINFNKKSGMSNFWQVFNRKICKFYHPNKQINMHELKNVYQQNSEINQIFINQQNNMESDLDSKDRYTGNQEQSIPTFK